MTCTHCNDTGEIRHDSHEEIKSRDGTVTQLGSSWTTLCQCRADLPARHGKVSWWTGGKSVTWEYESACEWLCVAVTASPELPVSDDGYPLHRTLDNMHFRTGAHVEITKGDSVLTSDDLRTLAAFLVGCADKIDAMDEPVADVPDSGRGGGE